MLTSSQDGANSRDEFFKVERFGDVIVSAEVETLDSVLCEAAGGEHNHRYVRCGRVGSHSPQDGQTVHLGHHHIEKHQVWWVGRDLLKRFAAASR